MASKSFDWGGITWQGDFDATVTPATKTAQMVDQSDFKLIRVIADLKLSKKNDKAINPQAKLHIQLTPGDIQKAGDVSKIKVAYWKSKWVVLSHISNETSLVTVAYDKVGDPPIAVGY